MHNRVVVHPRDGRDFEALVHYMMRRQVSLSRLHFTPGSHEVLYVPKGGHDELEPTEDLVDQPRPARRAPLALRGGFSKFRPRPGFILFDR